MIYLAVGEFFTPKCIINILVGILTNDLENNEGLKIYDPTCGSGSLILNLARKIIRPKIFLEEINETSYNITRINLKLNNFDYEFFNCGDALQNYDILKYKPIDLIISNPPYSVRFEGDKSIIENEVFKEVGVIPPVSKFDWGFILKCVHLLSITGKMAAVVFPGILYRGNSELKIRKYLIEKNYIETIIQLPVNVFFGTEISCCILVISKNKKNTDVFYLKAESFFKKKKFNIIDDNNLKKLLQIYKTRENTQNSRFVKKDEIINENYDLSLNRFIQDDHKSEKIDILAFNKQILYSDCKENILKMTVNKMVFELEDQYNEKLKKQMIKMFDENIEYNENFEEEIKNVFNMHGM